jgi:hypothetical protein
MYMIYKNILSGGIYDNIVVFMKTA